MRETIPADKTALMLGITQRTLWRWRDAGKLHEAPRVGRSVMFYADEVTELRAEVMGTAAVKRMTMAEVYKRLADAETWADIEELRLDMAATVCMDAEDQQPLRDAYRAACSMAATHPDEEARRRWEETATEYGAWLGVTEGDTANDISRNASSQYVTYETARAKAEDAPTDPAYAIAAAGAREGSK